MVQTSGVGLESGLLRFWDQMLATIEVSGIRYPSDYRLSLTCGLPDYSLNRGDSELLTIKQFLSDQNDAAKVERHIAQSQASVMRTNGHQAAVQWLTELCTQITDQADPDLLKNRGQ